MRSNGALLEAVDALWRDYDFTGAHSARLGQRMTPPAVASLIASMPSARRATVRLLDPGAGLGALTAAYVTRVLSRGSARVRRIEATAVEIDSLLLGGLKQTLDACKRECAMHGISFSYRIVTDEFVSSCMRLIPRSEIRGERFDCILMNPPYAKLGVDTPVYRLLLDSGVRVANWYAAFVVAALAVLADDGELVAITPRSFCNGTYFRPFRRALLSSTSLQRAHVFESRSAAFRRDDVLQETIIFHVRRSLRRPASVAVAASATPAERPKVVSIPYERVVVPGDAEMFIRLPLDHQRGDEARVATQVLAQLGLQVSTGPVVDFRVREHLTRDFSPGSAPLIYPMHFAGGQVAWPKETRKKYNAIVDSSETRRLLVPNERYVVVRRFSAKEERRRVVAAVYEPVTEAPRVGFENHLNYFHVNGHGLDRDLAWGLALFLNSGPVDAHLREFSGHTQVNAGDLRSLHYPTVARLCELGHGVIAMPDQAEIDRRVAMTGAAA